MADNSTDIIMYMTLDTGPVAAEARSQLDTTDDMIFGSQFYKDFKKGFFFELKSFSFGVSVKEGSKDADKKEEKPGASAAEKAKDKAAQKAAFLQMQKVMAMPDGPEKQRAISNLKGPKESEFRAFMEGGSISAYPVELSGISYERIMDKGSSIIWNYFNSEKSVIDAVILKRKDDGWAEGPQGYLALYFQDLIITDIDWEGEDLIMEKVKMICRTAKVLYKKQKPDVYSGTLVSAGWGYIDGPS